MSAGARIELAPGAYVTSDGLRMQFARSSGPGGQNVNKVSSKAELWIRLDSLVGLTPSARERLLHLAGHHLTISGELHFDSDAERSQQANRKRVLDAARTLLIQAMREPKKRRKTRPTRGSKERRLASKKARSQIKAHRRGAD
jgi:ribosome-associated protein